MILIFFYFFDSLALLKSENILKIYKKIKNHGVDQKSIIYEKTTFNLIKLSLKSEIPDLNTKSKYKLNVICKIFKLNKMQLYLLFL